MTEPHMVDDSRLLDAAAAGIYRIAIPTLRVTAAVLGAAVRVHDRVVGELICECAHPWRIHRHYRDGTDCGQCLCDRWKWAWRQW